MGHSEDSDGPTSYEVWYIASGNPKDGVIVSYGVVPALESGVCYDITLTGIETGNYMVKVYQREGHPGTSELWSESCVFVVV